MSSWSTFGVPVIAGGTWLAGGLGATAAVAADCGDCAEPAVLVAVVRTRIRAPMSPGARV